MSTQDTRNLLVELVCEELPPKALKKLGESFAATLVASLHAQAGITTGDYEEACVKRALSDAAARTVVLASPEKLNTASAFQIAPLSQVSDIIMHREVDDALVAPYREMGINIILA